MRRVNAKRKRKLYAAQFGSYSDTIRAMDCITCGAPGPSDPSHVKPRSVGGKKHDLIPQCRRCHNELGHYGQRRYAQRVGIDLEAEAARLWEEHGDG